MEEFTVEILDKVLNENLKQFEEKRRVTYRLEEYEYKGTYLKRLVTKQGGLKFLIKDILKLPNSISSDMMMCLIIFGINFSRCSFKIFIVFVFNYNNRHFLKVTTVCITYNFYPKIV